MQPYFYEIDLKWNSGNIGTVAVHGLSDIQMAVPNKPGKEKNWTPDHMLGAAMSTSFMNDFLEIATSHNLPITSYQSRCFIKLEAANGLFTTTEIMLCPLIKLKNPELKPLALQCADKAEQASTIKKALRYNVVVVTKVE